MKGKITGHDRVELNIMWGALRFWEFDATGDDVDDSQGNSEKTKLDSGAISGDDIYEMLKKRSRSAFKYNIFKSTINNS